MKKYLITLLVFSFSALAQECKTIDLSAEGGVLHPLRATNQNGLGICHAEQLQRMLKAKIPGNPDLARVSLALIEKEQRDQKLTSDKKKAIRWKASDGTPGGYFFDAGNACSAYDFVKGQSVCESKNDLLENLTKSNPNDQKKILDALSLYFDGKSQNFSNDEELKFTKYLVDGLAESAKACPINEQAITKFVSVYSTLMKKELRTDEFYNLHVQKYLQSKNTEGYLKKIIPDIDVAMAFSLELQLERERLMDALNSQEECVNQAFSTNGQNMCPIEEKDVRRIFSLSSIGLKARDMYNMLRLSADRDDYFDSAVKCDGAKVKIPEDLNCATTSIIQMKQNSKDLTDYVGKFSELVGSNLESNTPVGISVCTRFFKNDNVTTIKDDFSYGCGNKEDPDYKAGEGSHAVTIIGRRCVEGKTQFLVHNSWGTSCGYYSKKYECNKQGGFWVSAEILSQNARSVNILK